MNSWLLPCYFIYFRILLYGEKEEQSAVEIVYDVVPSPPTAHKQAIGATTLVFASWRFERGKLLSATQALHGGLVGNIDSVQLMNAQALGMLSGKVGYVVSAVTWHHLHRSKLLWK